MKRFQCLFLYIVVTSVVGCGVTVPDHPCEGCRPCEQCVSGADGTAFCSAMEQLRTACVDGNVWQFNSCDELVEMVENCQAGNFVCIESDTQSAGCVCAAKWFGENCTECPEHWDATGGCVACVGGWTGDDCEQCGANWSTLDDCMSCLGNYDVTTACTECLPGWEDHDDYCGSCVGNFDPETGCAQCRNHWIDENNQCGTCPGNWDSAADCNACIGNFDEATDCQACAFFAQGDNCTECAEGQYGDDCSVCIRFVDGEGGNDAAAGTSWQTAVASIEMGLSKAANAVNVSSYINECELWITGGQYFVYRTTAEDTVQLPAGVRLRGGFAGTETAKEQRVSGQNATILDGHAEDDDTVSVFHVLTSSSADAYLDGVTIQNGAARSTGDNSGGGGLYVTSGRVEIVDCIFTDNRAFWGGAVYLEAGAVLDVRQTRFERNSAEAGGGLYCYSGDVEISDCTFVDNVADENGGGCYFYAASSGTVSDSVFTANAATRGGGVHSAAGDVSIFNSTFRSNTSSDHGGGLYLSNQGNTNSVVAGNLLIVSNTAGSHGGGVYLTGSDIYNSTIVDNKAAEGGGIAVQLSYTADRVSAFNCIVYGNTGGSYWVSDMGDLWFVSSIVSETAPGMNVGTEDPLLDTDYYPNADSPCIDAGYWTTKFATDKDGHPRTDIADVPNTGVGDLTYMDIGCFERQQ